MKNGEALHPDDVFAVLGELFSEVVEYFVSPEALPGERRELDEALCQHAAALARLQRLGALGQSTRARAVEGASAGGKPQPNRRAGF